MTESEAIDACRKAAARAKRVLAKAWPPGTAVRFRRYGNKLIEGTVKWVGFDDRSGEPVVFVQHPMGTEGSWEKHTTITDHKPERLTRVEPGPAGGG